MVTGSKDPGHKRKPRWSSPRGSLRKTTTTEDNPQNSESRQRRYLGHLPRPSPTSKNRSGTVVTVAQDDSEKLHYPFMLKTLGSPVPSPFKRSPETPRPTEDTHRSPLLVCPIRHPRRPSSSTALNGT